MALISLKKVTKVFLTGNSTNRVINNVSYDFPNRGLVAIKGKSGSGKSTLLNLIALLDKPSQGEIIFNNKDTSLFKDKDLIRFRSVETSFIFQHYNLIEDLTCLDNVMLPLLISGTPRYKAKKKAKQLLKDLNLIKCVSKKARKLSGGEKQRVAIARSLVTSPKVIFADEPTGAIDSKNATLVLSILKKLSEKILVILVSHNEQLIYTYSDIILELKSGSLYEVRNRLEASIQKSQDVKKCKKVSKWEKIFVSKNFSKNLFKNVICLLAEVVGISSILVGVGYFNGSKIALDEEKTHFANYGVISVSKEEYINLNNSPLKLVQQLRPDKKEILLATQDLEIFIKNDYSYFFPPSKGFELNGEKQTPTSFKPIDSLCSLTLKEDLFIDGEKLGYDSFKYVYVNTEFVDSFKNVNVGSTIKVEHSCQISYQNIKETVNLEYNFIVIGIIKEFTFLNYPKVFYSTSGLEEYLSTISLDKICEETNSYIDIPKIVNESDPSSAFTNYQYVIYLQNNYDFDEVKKYVQTINDDLILHSDSEEIAGSFSKLSSAFQMALILFIVIAIVGVVLILSLTTLSTFIANKKESSILYVLGGNQDNLFSIYSKESLLVILIALAISFALINPLSIFLNSYLYKQIGVNGLINVPLTIYFGVPYFVPIFCLAFSCLIVLLSVFIGVSRHKKIVVAEELKDE